MDVAAQRNTLENKLREWNKPSPTPTPFVPPPTVKGVRGRDGNPAGRPAIDTGPVHYPPLPDTTPPTSPPDPHNPPPLPDKEEDPSDDPDEDEHWDDQEDEFDDEDGPPSDYDDTPEVFDEGGREDYPADVQGAPMPKLSKTELALERQRKEDAERFGGKLGATVMQEARAQKRDHGDIPPFPFEKMHEIALEKGLDADKVVASAKRSYDLWNAYASNIKARALDGEEIPSAQLDEMRRLGAECCKIPAMLLGIPESALPEMIDEINKVADTSPEALQAKADADAQAMYNFSTHVVKVAQEAFGDDHAKVSASLTGAMALHFLGYNDRGYRRVRLAESFGQIMTAYQQQEAEEDAAKANAESPDLSELGGTSDKS